MSNNVATKCIREKSNEPLKFVGSGNEESNWIAASGSSNPRMCRTVNTEEAETLLENG